MESLLDSIFKPMNDLYTVPRELAAIWLEKPVITDRGRSARISQGMGVKIKDGELISMSTGEKPTHTILKCSGTLVNQFSILVKDNETGIESTIKI